MLKTKRLRIVVLGMMGRCPFGGQTWLYLNWLRGLHRLGHEVWYVEDDSVWPYDPSANTISDNCSFAVRHIAACLEEIGMPNQWAFRLADRKGAIWGLSETKLNDLYRSCDVLLNIVGATDLREEHMAAPLRIYVECDPVTAELQLANGDEHVRAAFSNHQQIITYGENYGAPDCDIPLNGIHYGKTRQPIDLDLWPAVYKPDARFFTTIGNYRQSGNDVDYKGQTYHWSKHHEWQKFITLPKKVAQPFRLAMMPDNVDDREYLQSHGWQLEPPLEMSLDIFGAYRNYFQQSRGEFTVAKDQNVRLRSGWFSERDACYLASGKPVIAQDTGFSNVLPTGEGLFSFSTIDEAAKAVETINGNYQGHCKAAREIAEEYFEAGKVAKQLLVDIGLT